MVLVSISSIIWDFLDLDLSGYRNKFHSPWVGSFPSLAPSLFTWILFVIYEKLFPRSNYIDYHNIRQESVFW